MQINKRANGHFQSLYILAGGAKKIYRSLWKLLR